MSLKEYEHEWYLKNKERLQALRKKYVVEHSEQIKAYKREWAIKNREKNRAKNNTNQRKFYSCHREEILAKLRMPEERAKRKIYERQYIAKNRAKRQSYMHEYQQKPNIKEHRRIKQLHRRKEQPERVRERARKYLAIPEVHERYLAHFRKFKKTEQGRLKARYDNQARRIRKLGITEDFTKAELEAKIKRAGDKCPYCQQPFTKEFHSKHELTLDHNPSVSKAPKGFVYHICDINPICRSCNAKKGNEDWVILDNEPDDYQ